MERRTVIRLNTLRANESRLQEALQAFDLERITLVPDAFVVTADSFELTKMQAYQDGWFYIQNLSSQLPALILHPQPGERILDMCAAPGSKTTQLAALMNNEGEIVANDASRDRCFKLRSLLDRYGVTNTTVITSKGEFLWRKNSDSFDRVLVDAPCSMADGRSGKEVKALARQQTYLLRSAIACTKPGGVIVYSTCTDTEEENEGVVEWLLNKVEGIEVVPIAGFDSLDRTANGCLRIAAHDLWEPFFVAVFRKKA